MNMLLICKSQTSISLNKMFENRAIASQRPRKVCHASRVDLKWWDRKMRTYFVTDEDGWFLDHSNTNDIASSGDKSDDNVGVMFSYLGRVNILWKAIFHRAGNFTFAYRWQQTFNNFTQWQTLRHFNDEVMAHATHFSRWNVYTPTHSLQWN